MPSNDAEPSVATARTMDRSAPPSPEERERTLAWRRGAKGAAGGTDQRVRDARESASQIAAQAFVALAENVRDYAIFLVDPDGIITFWGEGARLIKWWSKEEAEGAHLRLLYPPGGSDDGTSEDHILYSAEHGEYSGEGRRVRSDGSTFWAGVTLTALRDAQGTLLGFAKVTRDLTARRAADALLQSASAAAEEARRAAESANVAKSGFLATMSHEIRTPVNAIMGYLDLLNLEIGGPLTSEQRSYVERAARGSRHLLALVSEVLDFSRIDANRAPVARRAFRIGDTVSHALTLVTPQATVRGIALSDAVSGYASGLAAWGDAARVTQVIVNLLVNAVKFTDPRKGEAGRITVSAGATESAAPDTHLTGPGPWVYVRVEDTGSGIAPDHLEQIFEPFVQGDMTLTREHGGTGLGLAISRRLARAMGGEVVVRSQLGVGSTFLLWLPAAPVETLQTGGVPGHGPGGEALPEPGVAAPVQSSSATGPSCDLATLPTGSLRAVSDLLLAELERVLHAFVARMRSDPATPSAHALQESEVEDHFASFLADLAGTLANMDTALDEPSDAVRDGTAIQRVIAERHGAQRARLGWDESEVRREFRILHEELDAALKRRAATHLASPTEEGRRDEIARAMSLLDSFLLLAQRLSLGAYARTRSES